MKRQIQDDPMYDEDIEEKIGIKFRIVEVGGMYKIQKKGLFLWKDVRLFYDGDYIYDNYWYCTKKDTKDIIKTWREAKLRKHQKPKVIEEIDV